mgnify:FL=1
MSKHLWNVDQRMSTIRDVIIGQHINQTMDTLSHLSFKTPNILGIFMSTHQAHAGQNFLLKREFYIKLVNSVDQGFKIIKLFNIIRGLRV